MASNNSGIAKDAIIKAGWTGNDVNIAYAIAVAESGLNFTATHRNTNGTTDYGLFQVNSIHNPTAAEKTDPYANARKAYSIFKAAGSRWTPWSTYNNGAYRKSLGAAASIAATPGEGGTINGEPQTQDGGGIVGGIESGATGIVSKAIDPFQTAKATVDAALTKAGEFLNLYLMVMIGLVLIIIGLVILSKDRIGKIALDIATKGASKYLRKGSKVAKGVRSAGSIVKGGAE